MDINLGRTEAQSCSDAAPAVPGWHRRGPSGPEQGFRVYYTTQQGAGFGVYCKIGYIGYRDKRDVQAVLVLSFQAVSVCSAGSFEISTSSVAAMRRGFVVCIFHSL